MKWLKAIIALFPPRTIDNGYALGAETAAKLLHQAVDKQAAAEMLFATSDGAYNASLRERAFDSGITDWLYHQGYQNPRDMAEGIEQAQQMNHNMMLYGTIDQPTDNAVEHY